MVMSLWPRFLAHPEHGSFLGPTQVRIHDCPSIGSVVIAQLTLTGRPNCVGNKLVARVLYSAYIYMQPNDEVNDF